MPRMKLTEQAVKRLTVSEGREDFQDTDAGKGVGLALRVSDEGSKVWGIRYRLPAIIIPRFFSSESPLSKSLTSSGISLEYSFNIFESIFLYLSSNL